jgi:restriction system protein
MKPMPKYDEIMYPLLDYIRDEKEYNVREILDNIADKYFQLSEEQKKEIASNGHLRFLDRTLWARTYLKKAGLVEDPRRGFVKITPSGLDFLNTKRDIKKIADEDLLQFESFIDFVKVSKEKSKEDKNTIEENILSKNTPQENIEYGFNEISKSLQFDLLQKLKAMDPYYFEKVILILFQKMGYGDFEETSKSKDGGIDGIINQDKLGIERIYTQAKRYTTGNVGEKEIRNFIGAMSGDVSKGIFVTTSSFDQSAINKAKDARNHKIILIDGQRLTELMIEYGIGVQIVQEFKLKEIDDDFFVE